MTRLRVLLGGAIATAVAFAGVQAHAQSGEVVWYGYAGKHVEATVKAFNQQYTFTTHWTPVNRGGQNVVSIKIIGPSDTWRNGAFRPSFSICENFPNYRNNVNTDSFVNVFMPPADGFTVVSYPGRDCEGQYPDGFGRIDSAHHSWTVFTRHAPASR